MNTSERTTYWACTSCLARCKMTVKDGEVSEMQCSLHDSSVSMREVTEAEYGDKPELPGTAVWVPFSVTTGGESS